MVTEAEYLQKTFRKPRRVPFMPEGADDDDLGDHLMTKWCAKASVCFSNGLVEVATVSPTIHVQPHYPLWDGALLIT